MKYSVKKIPLFMSKTSLSFHNEYANETFESLDGDKFSFLFLLLYP